MTAGINEYLRPAMGSILNSVAAKLATVASTSGRRILSAYSAVDAFPVFQSHDLEEYNGRILRGEPTLAPRAKPVPMRLPLPRMQGADSIYDNQSSIAAAM